MHLNLQPLTTGLSRIADIDVHCSEGLFRSLSFESERYSTQSYHRDDIAVASAMGVYWGIVYKPDLSLGYGNRQLGTSTLIPELDGFI